MSKARTLRITEKAEDDLVDIWAFIAEDSPKAATAFIQKLEEKFKPLLNHPDLGPRRDYLALGLRAHFYKDYAIYYKATDREIIIIRVVHGARDRTTLFAGDEESS